MVTKRAIKIRNEAVNERRLKAHTVVLSRRNDGVDTLRAQLLTG
jgi:hypothetical protein